MPPLVLLWNYIKRHRISYSIGMIAIFLTNWMAVQIPIYLQQSIDLLNEDLKENQSLLAEYIYIMLAFALSMIVVRTLSRVLFFNPGRKIEYAIKNDMFSKLMHLQKDYYDKNPTGAVISKMNNDITGVRLMCGFGLMQIFNIISSLSLTPWQMWNLSPELTLYCVFPIVLVFGVVRVGMYYLNQHLHTRQTELQHLSTFVVSSLSGVDVLKSYEMVPWATQQFEQKNSALLHRSLSISWIRSFSMPILSNLENILKVLILLVGGMYVINADFTIGELTAFITYAGLLSMPLMALGWVTTMMQEGMVGLKSVGTVLSQPVPFEDRRKKETSNTVQPPSSLVVKGLTYQYPQEKKPTLKEISFCVKRGQIVGILGPIGSGKSTLVNCINRYLDAGKKQIFLGDMDLHDLHFSDLRTSIRTVTQEPFLFSDTIEENIRFGEPEIKPIAEDSFPALFYESALTNEIERFPNHEKTLVGEKGIMLSGGQKQRISLARAMADECDLLILDNVLSAVDYDTERFLLDQIYLRKHAHSVLIVSHRTTALKNADHILVLQEGKIVDQGTHEELIQRTGFYQETYQLQTEHS